MSIRIEHSKPAPLFSFFARFFLVLPRAPSHKVCKLSPLLGRLVVAPDAESDTLAHHSIRVTGGKPRSVDPCFYISNMLLLEFGPKKARSQAWES